MLIKIFHQYIFHLPSFSLWTATFLLPWFGKWHIITNCQNCVQPPYNVTVDHTLSNLLFSNPSQVKRNHRLLEGVRSPNPDYGSWWELNFFPLPCSKTFKFPFDSCYIQLSLRIQLFLLAPRHSGRLTKTKVCDSATEIPYSWRKICPESGQELWLVDVVVIWS